MAVVATFSICAGLLILTGFDLWISHKRWKQGFKDLNPLVQHFVKTSGPVAGLLSLGAINLLLIAGCILYLPAAIFLLGAKTALATLQVRSLI